MRLWSLHPGYLDAKGLVALWREGLLAQKVLLGNTKGYKNHPQLLRFKNANNPIEAIATYLTFVVDEADKRKYSFNRSKIVSEKISEKLPVTRGQIEYEFKRLLGKLELRDSELFERLKTIRQVEVHPMFSLVNGDVEEWEIV